MKALARKLYLKYYRQEIINVGRQVRKIHSKKLTGESTPEESIKALAILDTLEKLDLLI